MIVTRHARIIDRKGSRPLRSSYFRLGKIICVRGRTRLHPTDEGRRICEFDHRKKGEALLVARIQKENANIFLRSLLPPDYASISRHFARVTFPARSLILPARSEIEYLDFPEHGILALNAETRIKAACLTALVGREGFVGWPALMDDGTSPYDVRAGGQGVTLLRLAIVPMFACAEERRTLRSSLLRFVHAVMLQMQATILSSKTDTVEQRLARLILMHHDRAQSDDILITHQDMADMLVIRRASVTDALHIMEGDRLIASTRNHIVLRDRLGLCQIAGQAYTGGGSSQP